MASNLFRRRCNIGRKHLDLCSTWVKFTLFGRRNFWFAFVGINHSLGDIGWPLPPLSNSLLVTRSAMPSAITMEESWKHKLIWAYFVFLYTNCLMGSMEIAESSFWFNDTYHVMHNTYIVIHDVMQRLNALMAQNDATVCMIHPNWCGTNKTTFPIHHIISSQSFCSTDCYCSPQRSCSRKGSFMSWTLIAYLLMKRQRQQQISFKSNCTAREVDGQINTYLYCTESAPISTFVILYKLGSNQARKEINRLDYCISQNFLGSFKLFTP